MRSRTSTDSLPAVRRIRRETWRSWSLGSKFQAAHFGLSPAGSTSALGKSRPTRSSCGGSSRTAIHSAP
jgi:hypothetical protein